MGFRRRRGLFDGVKTRSEFIAVQPRHSNNARASTPLMEALRKLPVFISTKQRLVDADGVIHRARYVSDKIVVPACSTEPWWQRRTRPTSEPVNCLACMGMT